MSIGWTFTGVIFYLCLMAYLGTVNLGLDWHYGIVAACTFSPFAVIIASLAVELLGRADPNIRQMRYNHELKMKELERIIPELPPDDLSAALPKNYDGFNPRTPDLPELVRLAKILKAADYRIRSRDLGTEYVNIRREFGRLEGVTNTNNKNETDLTEYGMRLVNDLCILSPAQVINPPLHVFRRVARTNHTQEME